MTGRGRVTHMNRWIIVAVILGLTTACDSGSKDAAPKDKADAKGDANKDAKADKKADSKADGDGAGVVVDTKGGVAPAAKGAGATPAPLPGL